MIGPFGFPHLISTDKATSFTAKVVPEFAKEKAFECKPILTYAPMSNGRAKRMVGTINHSIARIIAKKKKWDQAIPNVLYGYCCRKMRERCSLFELLYGTQPRMHPRDPVSISGVSTPLFCHAELLVRLTTRVEQVELQAVPEDCKRYAHRFEVGAQVLVIRLKALNPNVKWKPKYYGPCRVAKAKHSRYELVSQGNRVTREGVHTRRLMLFRPQARNACNCVEKRLHRSCHSRGHSTHCLKTPASYQPSATEKTS